MKSIKITGLVTLAALAAMAFVGLSSAVAESTQLCRTDENPCAASNVVSHVHETTLTGAKAKVLTNNIGTIECDALFLGDSLGLGSPLVIHGNFTYSNCKRGSENCTVKEKTTPSLFIVLKKGHETAETIIEVELYAKCGFFIDCTFLWEVTGTQRGPLLSTETNGAVTVSEAIPWAVQGVFCPGASKLDITLTSLEAVYISS